LSELKEVKANEVIEVKLEHVVTLEVCSVVELSKLEDDFDNLWLASGGKTIVVGSTENSFDALEHHLWADRVLSVVKRRVEVRVLLWNDDH